MEDEVHNFNLRSGTDSFVSRSRDVFANLVALEDKHSAFLKATASSRDKDDSGLIKSDPDEEDEFVNQAQGRSRDSEGYRSWSHGRSQFSKPDSDYEPRSRSRSPNRDNGSSIVRDDDKQVVDGDFKIPAQPPYRSNYKQLPDFKKHPEKYTVYSLRDVSEQDMSENSNHRAAFDFLEQHKLDREKLERKLAGLPEEPKFDVANAACSQGKITFSHPRQKKEQSIAPDKSVSKDGIEVSLLKSDLALVDNDEESKDSELKSVSDEIEVNINLPEARTGSGTFKSRKNVKRHIRTKGSDSD